MIERSRCIDVFEAERSKYVTKLKEKISTLSTSDKKWWRLNRELLNRKANVATIPTLREDTKWLSDPKSKADAFARVFASKSQLPAEAIDCPFFGVLDVGFKRFTAFLFFFLHYIA